MLLCKRSGNKLSHSWLSAQKPALVARLKPCPFTRVAQPKPYATPSTIESPAAVGMIRESFHPDASNNLRNSGSVRSRPLGENQHLQIQKFSGREVVARLNHAIYHQQLSAGIYALAAGF